MRLGVQAGLNFTSIQFSRFDPEKKLLIRMNIGATIEIPFNENWLLYTGPYYSGKGMVYGRSFTTNKIDSFTIRLNYIELPINIGYKFSEENKNRLSISGGPYISYGFNGKISIRNSSRPPTIKLHKKETEKYKRIEMGFNFLSSYEIKNSYGIKLYFSKSLLNIAKYEKEKNIVLGFSFFWYLKNKKNKPD